MILLFRPPRDAPGRGLAGSGAFSRRGKTPRSRGGKPEKQKKKRRAIARRPVLRGVEKCGNLTVALQQRQAVGHTTREGVLPMRITLHIGRFTVTIIVKSRNRHPGR